MIQISTMFDPYPVALYNHLSPARSPPLQSPSVSFPHRPSAGKSSTCPRTSWRRLALKPHGVQHNWPLTTYRRIGQQRAAIWGQPHSLMFTYYRGAWGDSPKPNLQNLFYTCAVLLCMSSSVFSPLRTNASLRYVPVLMQMTNLSLTLVSPSSSRMQGSRRESRGGPPSQLQASAQNYAVWYDTFYNFTDGVYCCLKMPQLLKILMTLPLKSLLMMQPTKASSQVFYSFYMLKHLL